MTSEINDCLGIAPPAVEKAVELTLERPELLATIEPRPCRTSVPLTLAQQRMWLVNQLEPDSPLYNRARASRWTGPLDAAALERSLAELIRRHEVLRTRFPLSKQGAIQEIAAPDSFQLPVVDFGIPSRFEREEKARRWMLAEAGRPFHLTQEPPFRAFLLRLAPDEHLILLVIHHIASDRWSRGVLLGELVTLYTALASGRPSPLPELKIQYGDYAVWQQEHYFQGPGFEADLAYWRDRLRGAPAALSLPTDRPRPQAQTHVGAQVCLTLPADLVGSLTGYARRERASAFMVLLAGFKALWVRSTGQTDIVIGAPVTGRTGVELEKLIGCFANTLVLRTDLSGDPTFQEILSRVREVTLGGFDHQELPFEKLVEELRPPRIPGCHPLFQVLFNSHLDFAWDVIEIPGLSIEDIEIDLGTALVDLSLDFKRESAGWVCHFTYNTDVFDHSTVARLARQYRVVLEAAVAKPEQRLSALPLPLPVPASDEFERVFQELEQMSDEDAERLLAESRQRSR
jgi:hypothetical protein